MHIIEMLDKLATKRNPFLSQLDRVTIGHAALMLRHAEIKDEIITAYQAKIAGLERELANARDR